MIKRKLQGHGFSKQVTLPKHWIDANNLKLGDEIYIGFTSKGDVIVSKNELEEITR